MGSADRDLSSRHGIVRWPAFPVAIGSLACSLFWGEPSLADNRRIALIDADAQLLRSASVALSPWGIDAIAVDLDEGPEQLQDLARASETSQRLAVEALVWVSVSGQEATLWVYGARTKGLTSRKLEAKPPFVGATAATVALTLKTLLRESSIARDEANTRAPVSPTAQQPATPAPEPEDTSMEAASPRSARGGAVSLGGTGTSLHTLDVRSLVTARWASSNGVEPRGGIGLSVWPRALDARLGATVELATGPGISIATAEVSGRYRSIQLSASARSSIPLGAVLSAEPLFGMSVHSSAMRATSKTDAESMNASRVVLSIDAGMIVGIRLADRVSLGLRATGSYLPKRQAYLVRGAEVLKLWPVAFEVGGDLRVSMF